MTDKDGISWSNTIGMIGSDVSTSNIARTYMAVRPNISDKTTGWLTIQADASGNITTSAPTPTTTDNSTQIATTAYVNNRISDIESKLTYVGVSGSVEGESVDGNKLGLVLNSVNSTNDGAQIVFKRSKDTYYNTILDQYQNQFRIFQNAASNGRMARIIFDDDNTVGYIGTYLVDTVTEKSIGQNGYIRYYSGLQIVWAQVTISSSTASSGVSVTFSKAFKSEPRLFLQESYTGGPYSYVFTEQPVSRSATGFTYYVSKWNGTAMSWDNGTVNYLAIGPWK